MFHYFDTITNTRGDSLPNWQVECVTVNTTTVVPIFADENSTPIVNVSGVANRAVADENGNYDFFVPNGTYSLRFYNAQGVFQRTQRYLPMYGAQSPATVRTISGTSYTLAANDENAVLRFTNASAITVTLPSDADAGYPVGGGTEFHQKGTGAITFVAGTGATLEARGGLSETAGQFAIAGVRKDEANTFVLTGDLV